MSLKNLKKGFSLVELVIVIAILAILIAVLAPSLMTYTERSRAQKDVTTMDEVVNAVQLAMADQDCYDEMIKYSCKNNYITYTDSSGNYGQVIADGEYWAPDGLGRATTITFNPEKDSNGDTIYRLENGIVNDMTYGNGSVAQPRDMQGAQTNNQCYLKNASINGSQTGYLYNRIRQTIGDDVITSSATYANSSFTIFIKFNQKDGVTVADVNGSFNGTNLSPDSSASKGSGTITYDPETEDAVETINGGKQESDFTNTDLSGGGSFSPDYKLSETDTDLTDDRLVLNSATTMQYDLGWQFILDDVELGRYYDEIYVIVTDENGKTEKRFLEYADTGSRQGFVNVLMMPATKAVDKYTAQLFGVKDGKIYAGQKIESCIADNLIKSWNNNQNDPNARNMVASALGYIDAIQIYFNYKTNQLATKNAPQALKDAIASFPTPQVAALTYDESGYQTKYSTSYFMLNGQSKFIIRFYGKDWLGSYADVTIDGKTTRMDMQIFTSSEGVTYEDYAELIFKGQSPSNGTTPMIITIYDKNGVQRSTTYSISPLQIAMDKHVEMANYIIYTDKWFG